MTMGSLRLNSNESTCARDLTNHLFKLKPGNLRFFYYKRLQLLLRRK